MLGLGTQELLIVLLVVVLLFGAKKLPELARGMGQGLKEFKQAAKEVQREDEEPPAATPKSGKETV